MGKLMHLIGNYYLIVAIIAWVSAQVLKTLFTFIKTKKVNLERMVGAGGMPSAHSATVCALAVAISRKVGVASPEFALAVIFAAIVMYDAMGVRRATGENAKVINKMVDAMKAEAENEKPAEKHDEEPLEFYEDDDDFSVEELGSKELKEFIGHTPFEVLAGALLGILIAMLIPII